MSEESQVLEIKLPDKAFFRPDEVANYLRKHKKTIYQMIHDGELVALKIRGRFLIPKINLEKYLQSSYKKSLSLNPP